MAGFARRFEARFLTFLIVFAVTLAVLIVLRQVWAGREVSVSGTLVWQLLVWMPLVALPRVMAWLAGRVNRNQAIRWRIMSAMLVAVFLAVHVVWYVALSSLISPLSDLPNTRFGVFPYFFLFFAMMDIAIIWGTSVRVGLVETLKEKPSPDQEEAIVVKSGANSILLPAETIHWIAAEDYYARIHSEKGVHLLRQPMKVLADRLPAGDFIQIHRSTIVRRDFIDRREGNSIVLRDGTSRPASRAGLQRLAESMSL